MKNHLLIFLKSIIFFISWAILISFNSYININNPIIWRFFAELIPLLMIILISFLFIKFIDKNNIKIIVFNAFFKNFIIGILIGTLWICLPIIILITLKLIKITNVNSIPYLYMWILSCLLNVIMQELLVRGYLYQLFKTNYNFIISTILTSLLFTLLHGGAFEAGVIAVLNIFTTSVFLSLLLETTNTLLAPIIAHFIWNALGSIIFNVVSLASDYPNMLNITSNTNNIIYNSTYKLEGSILVLILNIILIFILIKYKNKNIA